MVLEKYSFYLLHMVFAAVVVHNILFQSGFISLWMFAVLSTLVVLLDSLVIANIISNVKFKRKANA